MISDKLQLWSWFSLLPHCPCSGWPLHMSRYIDLEGIVLFPLFRFCSVEGRFCSVIAPGLPWYQNSALTIENVFLKKRLRIQELRGSKFRTQADPALLFHGWGQLGLAFIDKCYQTLKWLFLNFITRLCFETSSPKYCLHCCKVFDFIYNAILVIVVFIWN